MAIPLTERNLFICGICLDGCIVGASCSLFKYYRRNKVNPTFKMCRVDNKTYFEEFWKKNRDREISKRKKWARENVSKRYASHALRYYMKKHNLPTPEFCSICSSSGRIVGHHPNYTDPFNVVWVCSGCHKKIHNGSLNI